MKPNHSNSDIYGDIDSWSLKEAPERLKVNSDNLKEQISEILDLVEVGVGGVTRLKGDEWVDGISVDKATDQLLQLFQDYAMGCVPPVKYTKDDIKKLNKKVDSRTKAWADAYSQGWFDCRQEMLNNLEGKS